jgi:hypothetical protein
LVIRISAVLAALFSAALLGQSWRGETAELCFVRPEDNGSINILESWVRVSDYRVPLFGGQSACVFVHPGVMELVITSRVPYEPTSKNEEACTSRPVKLELASHDRRVFAIDPATKGSAYVCGWRVRPMQTNKKRLKKDSSHP